MISAYDIFKQVWEQRFQTHDFEGLRNDVDPEVFRLRLPGLPPLDIDGAIEFARLWASTYENFGDTSPETRKVLGFSELVTGRLLHAHLEEHFRHTGTLLTPDGTSIEPTGKVVTVESIHDFRVNGDGRVTEWTIMFDWLSLIRQHQA